MKRRSTQNAALWLLSLVYVETRQGQGHGRFWLGAFAQDLRLQLNRMTPTWRATGVFHGVHLFNLVDTIVLIGSTNLKMTSLRAYVQ